MKRFTAIAFAIGAGATLCAAQTPATAIVAPAAKVPGITTTASGLGGFQMNQDDCTLAHTNLGTGPVAGLTYDTSLMTTGGTGQTEAICLFFGLNGINNDGWGNWTASTTGTASASTCGSGVDTKIAVYPLSVCPAAQSSIACNDDACGLQTTVAWDTTAGTTYTLQLGTFPGAVNGAGVWQIDEFGPPPCGQKDDGTTENALGMTQGGELGWMTNFTTGPGTCLETWDSVLTAYGAAAFPGTIPNGTGSQIVVYHDSAMDNDPTTGLTVDVKVNTLIVNGNTDIMNKIPLGITIQKVTLSDSWVLASGVHQVSQFPAPIDQTPPTHTAGAWWAGAFPTGTPLDTTNLNNNPQPPVPLTAAGVAGNWLLRVENTGGPPTTGTPLCFGDGSGAPCGCANESNPGSGSGCLSSTSLGGVGAVISASGTADTTNASLELNVTGVSTDPGLWFQGTTTIAGGAGLTFGSGIRCCGGAVIRVGIDNPPPTPVTATTTTTITTNSAPTGPPVPPITTGINPGDKRCYQYWYRDAPTGLCTGGAEFNLSNAVTVTWI